MSEHEINNIPPDDLLLKVFPFLLTLDGELRLQQVGHLMREINPHIKPGLALADCFMLVEPSLPLTFETLRELDGIDVFLRMKESDIRYHGRVQLDESNGVIYLPVAPWYLDIYKLELDGVDLDDFFVQAPILDLLNIVQARTVALEDSRRLNDKLFEQSRELTKANSKLKDQGTRLQSYADELKRNSFHDVLTGLPNRPLFINLLEKSIAAYRRRKKYLFAVFFADLDRFKVINDGLGHVVGDHLLVEVAARLQECIRVNDTVARFGGDEFVFLIDDINGSDVVTQVARRIQEHISQPFNIDGHEIYTSISIGVAYCEPYYNRPEDILRDADTAMYRAKSMGNARCEIFNQEMHGQALAQLRMESDLRSALKTRDQFHLLYQPIYSLKDNQLTGFEALARWNHPRRGFVSPVEFIPVAEDTGLIVELGRQLFIEACRQMAEWRNQGYTEQRMYVNISQHQFKQKNFVNFILETMQEYDLDSRFLGLEITESLLMDDEGQTLEVLNSLSRNGLRLSLDDFGTGYSSLSYLKRFPVDNLKIDRSFVMDVMKNKDDAEIIRAIIAMGHTLNMEVTAEGVETEEQLHFLRQQGCDRVQGYYLSKPLPAGEIQELISANGFRQRMAL